MSKRRTYYIKAGNGPGPATAHRDGLTKTEALETLRDWMDRYDWTETGSDTMPGAIHKTGDTAPLGPGGS